MKALWLWLGMAGIFVLGFARQASAGQGGGQDGGQGGQADPGSTPSAGGATPLANAIAFAEGYGADPGNVPTRANNPGDLKLDGYPVTGAEGIAVFPTAAEGWAHLDRQVALIASGRSRVYRTDMSLGEMGAKWTDTASTAWVDNVVAYLNDNGFPDATRDTPIGAVLA